MVAFGRCRVHPDRRADPAVGTAQADPNVLVYPGMEIIQGTNVCTLGYVDPQARVAFTAGHCRGDGMVRDKAGNVVGNQALFRDNTPDGTTIDTNHQIADWEAISLAPDVQVNNVLPGGRPLVSDPGIVPTPGLAVCHFGVVTSESCGTDPGGVQRLVHHGQRRGESEGRLRRAGLRLTPDGRAAIIGMFNSTWGQYPAAVSWQVASKQASEDVISAASGSLGAPAAP